MPRRSPARFLAPLALLTAILTVFLVARSELGSSPESSSKPSRTTSTSADGAKDGAAPTARRKARKGAKAKTYTVGAVLTPNLGLGRFSATIDYYNIKIDQVITTQGAQFYIDQCFVDGIGSDACNRVRRNLVTGQIDAVNTSIANQGTFKTSGVDASVNFAVPFSDVGLGIPGRLRLQAIGSYLKKVDFGGGNFSGRTGGGIGGTYPKYKATTTVAYDSDSFTAQLRWNWQSSVIDATFGDNTAAKVPGLSYFDLSLRKTWQLGDTGLGRDSYVAFSLGGESTDIEAQQFALKQLSVDLTLGAKLAGSTTYSVSLFHLDDDLDASGLNVSPLIVAESGQTSATGVAVDLGYSTYDFDNLPQSGVRLAGTVAASFANRSVGPRWPCGPRPE